MKNIIYTITLISGVVLANVCYSEDKGTDFSEEVSFIEIYGDIGLSSAISPEELKNYRSSGFNINIGADKGMMSIGKFDISFGGRFALSSLEFNVDEYLKEERGIEEGYNITGGGTSVIALLGTAKATLSSIISPYFYGGMGVFRLSTKDATMYELVPEPEYEVISGSSENTFGISFGAGVEAGAPFGLFAEGQYIIGFTENTTQILFPVKLGVIYKWK